MITQSTAIRNLRRERWQLASGLCLAVGLALVSTAGSRVQSAETNAMNPEALVIPRSVFENIGRDPFHPNSTRPKTTGGTQVTNVPPPTIEALLLRGITGPATNRIALINNLTFREGEEQDVRVDDRRRMRVLCVKILDERVVIRVEGQREDRELRLPERLLPTGGN